MHRQNVVSAETINEVIKTLNNKTTKGHPVWLKKLHKPRARCYSSNMAEKVKHFVDNCKMSTWTKQCHDKSLLPPLEQIYDPCNGLENILQKDSVIELSSSNSYTYMVTVTDVISCYLFAILICSNDTASVVKSALTTFTHHAYVSQQILADKDSAFTSKLLTELVEIAGVEIALGALKHVQKIGVNERLHQKLKQKLKIDAASNAPHSGRYVKLAVMANNSMYHRTLNCSSSEIFHGPFPHNALNLKFSHPLQTPQNATDIKRLVDQINQKQYQSRQTFHCFFLNTKNSITRRLKLHQWK